MSVLYLALGLLLPGALHAESARTEASQLLDCAAQTSLITQAVKNYYGISGDLSLTATSDIRPIAAAPTSVELLEVPEVPCSTTIIRARYMDGSHKVGDLAATFHAQWKVPVFVPRCQIARGVPLNSSDFDTQMVDRLAIHQAVVEPSTKLADYELVSALPAGTPLTWNYLRSQPLVKKGSMVDVIAQEGVIKITTRAVAMQDAGRGEQVVMHNPTSNRQFEAYVINENLVQIHF